MDLTREQLAKQISLTEFREFLDQQNTGKLFEEFVLKERSMHSRTEHGTLLLLDEPKPLENPNELVQTMEEWLDDFGDIFKSDILHFLRRA